MHATTFTPQKAQTRKQLAALIAGILETEVTYLGAPSMAYQIGEVILDRAWQVTWPPTMNKTNIDRILHAARQAGFTIDSTGPDDDASGLRSHVETAKAGDGLGLCFAFPTHSWTSKTAPNLEAMLTSKGPLICKALGIPGVPVLFEDGRVVFDWFTTVPSQDVSDAALELLTAMIQMAKVSARISPLPSKTRNEKYAMRCFLLRLGFIGENYRATRRILLANLEGNAAWATPRNPTEPAPSTVS